MILQLSRAAVSLRDAAIMFLVAIAISLSAHAAPGIGNATRTNFKAQSKILPVAAYDGIDPRETEDQYAKSHGLALEALQQSASAAVGQINCNGWVANANITESPIVIATVGHVLCNKKSGQAPTCKFKYVYRGRERIIPISDFVTGYDCAHPVDEKDWAVAKLTLPALGPSPFKIRPSFGDRVQEDRRVIFIATGSIDFCLLDKMGSCLRNPTTHVYVKPKYLVECLVKLPIRRNSGRKLYVTNCPGSGGASGGAVINSDIRNPVLLAIQTGTQELEVDQALEKRTGKPVIKPFSLTDPEWYATSLAVTGEFAEAIARIAGTAGAVFDIRETEAQYAESRGVALAKLRQSLSSAVGEIRCGDYTATANVTESTSVITTSAQIFCRVGGDISKCKFSYYYEDMLVSTPLTDKSIGLDCAHYIEQNDWAVAKLKSPAVGLTPLGIIPSIANRVQKGQKVTFIATSHSGSKQHAHTYNQQKYLVDCFVKRTVSAESRSLMQYLTDCPASRGSPGGAMTDGDINIPVLLAIQTGTHETPVLQELRPNRPGITPSYPTSESTSDAIGSVISGAFAEAISKMAGTTSNKR